MTRFIFLMLSLVTLLIIKARAQPPVSFDLVGYATMNGGTTGGQKGETVSVSNLNDLKMYAEAKDTPYIIIVNGRITSGDDKGAVIKVQSNKTLLGKSGEAFLDGIGLTINASRNVIVRNIKFTMTSITNTTDPLVYDADGDEGRPQILTNGGDCIKIQKGSTNVWIDHCELYAKDPTVQKNQDLYDGLIDVSGESKYITISWCFFHDHHKCNLIGSSDSDNHDRMVTIHHNFFYKISQRTPSYRFGQGHVFNNYFLSVKSSGINSRMGACLGIERNVFEKCTSPVTVTSGGLIDVEQNSYIASTGSTPTISTCSYEAPYNYSKVYQSTDDLKKSVEKFAGVGVLSEQNLK